MLRITLKSARGHIARFVLTAIAVTLGVSLVAGTFVLRDSIQNTLDDLITGATKGTDVLVRGRTTAAHGADSERQPLPLSLADELSKVEGVKRADPGLQGFVMLIGKDGKVTRSGSAPTLGFAFRDDDPAFVLVSGRGPTGAGEVVVEESTLKRSGLAVGDQTKAIIGTQIREVRIVGEVRFGALFGATATLVDEATARQEFAPQGMITSFSLTAEDGVSQETLLERVKKVLPAGAEALTGKTDYAERKDGIDKGLKVFSFVLLAFAFVSLFVGVFIIFNTFSMLVAQRTRELALLRAVGAARGQVLRLVLGEAAFVGLVGSLLGIAFGTGLAGALQGLSRKFLGADISAGLPVRPMTVVLSLVVGIGVTLLSAYVPARRAARIAPVAAMRDDMMIAAKGLLVRGAVGGAMLLTGAAATGRAVAGGSTLWKLFGLGAVLVVLGTVTVAPVLARPVVRVLAWPFVRLGGVVSRLARQNALRVPRRTATTASALMIGLALIAAVSVVADSLKVSVKDVVAEEFRGDFFVDGGAAPLPADLSAKAAQTAGVAAASALGTAPIRIGETRYGSSVVSGSALTSIFNLKVVSGTAEGLSGDRMLVSRKVATERGWKIGDTVKASVGGLKDQQLTVLGIFERSQVLGDSMIIDRGLYERAVPPEARYETTLLLAMRPGADASAVRTSLDALTKPYVYLKVQDRKQFLDGQMASVNQLLGTLYVLLFLSIVIAVLGIVNTLALSVFERTREIGLLRAVGLRRRQLARMITLEAVCTAVFGAVLGLVVGVLMGWALQHGLRDSIDRLSIPWGTVIVVFVAAAITGVVAAVLPAIRAVRLNMLKAIATD